MAAVYLEQLVPKGRLHRRAPQLGDHLDVVLVSSIEDDRTEGHAGRRGDRPRGEPGYVLSRLAERKRAAQPNEEKGSKSGAAPLEGCASSASPVGRRRGAVT